MFSTISAVEQGESSLSKPSSRDNLPVPTLLTDADFSSRPFLEEDVRADAFLEEQNNEVALLDTDKLPVNANIEGEMKKGSKKEEEEDSKGEELEGTTRKSFLLQGIRVTVREGGGRRWKLGSRENSDNLVLAEMEERTLQAARELDRGSDAIVEEGDEDEVDSEDVSFVEDERIDLAPSIDITTNDTKMAHNITLSTVDKVDSEESIDSEGEAVEVKLNSDVLDEPWLSGSDEVEKVKEVVLSTELSGGGRQERGGGDRGQELQHFLRIGATMEEGLSLLAEEQSSEERKIVRTRFSSASSENIHLLCIWHLCLPLIALITL